ncbi:hypothetical protein [Sinorhizobium meliloti]|uniref:hypothetical protein n=1 Tax=Rhizobium meliloti TaxID=382 RepID=UPI001E5EA195|nr:hypothetical protein [Sinorhizobium meliloti]UFX13028.1 hypothetical protein SmelRRI128_33325 [Sinorhizobium meliloti]
MQKLTCGSFVDAANALAKIWMPAIMNLDFIADMGRMNGEWESEEKIGSSLALTPARRHWHVP